MSRLELESDIKTIYGEIEARIGLIEKIEEISDYTLGRKKAYEDVLEMLEEFVE